jgi:peroxiredoxin
MDKNNEAKVNDWVDEHLATLNPDGKWKPNVARGLTRFKRQRNAGIRRGRSWAMAAAIAAVACICLLTFPTSRDAVQNLWRRSSGIKVVDVGKVSADVKTLKDGQLPPDFTLKDSTGANIQLSAYKGKVVLLNFWATWCGGCKVEIPWLVEFEKRYKNSGLAVIGVSMDENGWKTVKPFLEESQINYPVVIGDDAMAKAYRVVGMPMTILIGRDGKIAARSVGIIDKNNCENEIIRLLKP